MNGKPVLIDLQGRAPVRFRTTSGEWLNNIEVTHALQRFEMAQLTLHQREDGSLVLRFAGAESLGPELASALGRLLGAGITLRVDAVSGFEGKVIQYTSELDPQRGAVRS